MDITTLRDQAGTLGRLRVVGPRLRSCGLASGLILWATAEHAAVPAAHADDGNTIPTPIGFASRTCTVEVDRSKGDTATLRPTLPFEDTILGVHEPPNSRRLQLFALCQDLSLIHI